MNLKHLVFSTFLFSFFACFSNGNVKSYRVTFPFGSSFINQAVQEQIVQVYNEVPLLHYVKIGIKGEEGRTYSKSDLLELSKERAKNVVAFFLKVGLKQEHVKILYGGTPEVMIFKPKEKLSNSSNLSEYSGNLAQEHSISAANKTVLVSQNNLTYIFTGHSFETDQGIPIDEGSVDVKLIELMTNDDLVKSGVVGETEGKLEKFLLCFRIQAFYNGRVARLKQGYRFSVLFQYPRTEGVVYHGKLTGDRLNWEKAKMASLRKRVISKEELYPMGDTGKNKWFFENKFVAQLFSESLGWTKCVNELSNVVGGSLKVSIPGDAKYAVYLVASNERVIIPAYENLSFNNLYQFKYVPNDMSFQLVAVPIEEQMKSFVYLPFLDDHKEYYSPSVISCEKSKTTDCFKVK